MTAKNEAEADLGKQFSGKKVHMYSSISPSVLGMQCLMPIREINLMHNCKLVLLWPLGELELNTVVLYERFS